LILIGLDLPGIQETVYTIASRGAGKSVRGRSAFVQLMVNAIVDRIVRDLNLCRANVLINAGGNALILAGATAQVESYLQSLDHEINELLLIGMADSGFTGFQGDLALALAWTKLPWDALTYPCEKVMDDGHYISRWQFHEKELKEKLQATKMRPFGALVATEAGFHRLFATEPIDSNRYCAVCRRPESKKAGVFASWHEEEPEILGAAALACPVCKSFVNLADSLGKHGLYLERTTQAPNEMEVWQRGLYAISGYWYSLIDQPSSRANTLTLALSPDDFPASGVSGFWPMATTTPLITAVDRAAIALAGEKPVRGGSIRDNALLADESPGTFKRLGVLKADVDSLGELLVNS
jgi:CRISPR-associated protein Cas10/Csm1 subtype III-A